jgi:hypothetical protein
MNVGHDGHGIDELGEEFIDPLFVPRHLPPGMQSMHRILFGSVRDRLFMNYRMRQIMQIMHASPLEQDLLVQDSRITYLPFKPDLFNVVESGDFPLASVFSRLEATVNLSALEEIFPPTVPEPFVTWLRIYQESQQATVFRFSALMLAFAERVESFPQVRQ